MHTAFARRFLFGVAASAVLVALVAAILLVWNTGSSETAEAAHDGVTAATPGEDVAFDMLTAGNTASALGPVDNCVSVVPPGTPGVADVTFDVVFDGLPVGFTLSGYNYFIVPKPGHSLAGLTVITKTDVVDAPVNVIIENQGKGVALALGSAPPFPLSGFAVADADLGAATFETNPPTVRGIMNEFGVDVDGAAPGLYPMVFSAVQVFDVTGAVEIFDPDDQQADAVDTDGDTLTDEDSLIDAYDGFGLIAVGVACPLGADIKDDPFDAFLPGPIMSPPFDANDIPVSFSIPVIVTDVLHNNGPETPVDVDVDITCAAPESILVPLTPGGSCSYHVNAAELALPGDLLVTINGATIATNPPASTVFDVPWPDVLDVHYTVSLPFSVLTPVTLEFDVHCYEPSTHNWHFEKDVSPTSQFVTDGDLSNNHKEADLTLDCIAFSDLKVSQIVTIVDPTPATPIIGDDGFNQDPGNGPARDEDGAGDCNGDGIANDDGDGLTDEDGGDCYTIKVDKTIHNNGPWAPAPTLLNPVVAITSTAGVPYACTATLLATSDPLFNVLAVSVATPVTEEYAVNCPQLGYQIDDDGDSPEQPCGGPYNLALTQCINGVDEDCPEVGPQVDNDGDGKFSEDCSVSIEVVNVFNLIVPTDVHTIDTDLGAPGCNPLNPNTWAAGLCGDNGAYSQVPVTDYLPFNPSHSVNQDEVAPSTFVPPSPSVDCLITLPCKMQWDYNLPGGNPLAQAVLDVPIGAYTLSRASNYALVAQFTGLATIGPLGFTCGAAALPFTVPLNNAALPLPAAPGANSDTILGGVGTAAGALPAQLADNFTDGADSADDADALVDDDPPDYLGAGFISTDQDGDTAIDEDDGTAIVNPMSWAKHLDAQVLAVTAGNADAALMARYTGFVVVAGTVVAVNVLVFFDPTPGVYLAVPVTADPDDDGDFLIDPIDPDDDNDGLLDYVDPNDDNDLTADVLETKQCTPLTVTYIQLGTSAADADGFPPAVLAGGGETLQVCNIINTAPGWPISGSFRRADIGTTTTLFDFLTCSGNNDVEQHLAKDENVGNGVASPQTDNDGDTVVNEDPLGLGDTDGDTLVDEDPVDAHGVDNDGDTSVDEDPAGGGDTDGDTAVDEDGPGDGLIPVGIEVGVEVDVIIVNGAVPTSIDEELSLVSKAPCVAQWDTGSLGGDGSQTSVVLDPLITVGPTNISVLHWAEGGDTGPFMDANESVNVTAKYMIKCSAAGSQNLQIESLAVSNPPLPDDQPLDNEDQNNPKVNYGGNDIDGDGDANANDNCPFTPNPDQADNDGDGVGDACDNDDDNDGFLDLAELCDFLAEDVDGEADTDGCPETDMSLTVVKDNPIKVAVSQNKVSHVKATATNGNYGLFNGHGVIFFELLKSNVTNPADKCVANWIPAPGDLRVTDTVVEFFNGVPGQLVFMDQLQVTYPTLPPFNNKVKDRDYTVHCNARSSHVIFLEEGIAPTAPIQDPNVNNNVHKQYITVNAWDQAEIKVVSHDIHSVTGPTGNPTDVDGDSDVECPTSDTCATTVVVVKKVLHNNGPSEADVLISAGANVPADCTATLTDHTPVYGTHLPVSVQAPVFETWSVECAASSDHSFTFDNAVATDEIHLEDPIPGNNTDSSSTSVEIIGNTTIGVDVTVNNPLEANVSEDETFTVDKTISNTGPFDATPKVTQTLSVTGANAGDCNVSFHSTAAFLAAINGGGQGLTIKKDGVAVNPPTPAGWEPSDRVFSALGGNIQISFEVDVASHDSVALTEEWDKHCFAPSSHTFSLATSVARVVANDPHVAFPTVTDTDPFSENITANADLKIASWTFLDNVSQIGPNSWFIEVPLTAGSLDDRDADSKEKLHNNGPFGPVNTNVAITATPGVGCDVLYEVSGNESSIVTVGNVEHVPAPAGTVIGSSFPMTIKIPVTLPVSVDVWIAERFGFAVQDHTVKQCSVSLVKTLDAVDTHIDDANGASASKTFTVCLDTDSDGIADSCAQNGEKDNCTAVPNPGQQDTDGDGLGDACDARADHDLNIDYCIKIGPAPVNISDYQGHYMWALCQITVLSDHDEVVNITISLGAVPAGCNPLSPVMILPGQSTILLQGQQVDNDGDTRVNEDPPDGLDNDGDSAVDEDGPDGEQKIILFRTRFECHTPATQQLLSLPVEICANHVAHSDPVDDDGDTVADEDPIDGIDNDGDSSVDEDPPEADTGDDCHAQIEQVIIDVPPPPGP